MKHLLLAMALLGLALPASAQRVALTFDDGFDPAVEPRAVAWNTLILDTLKEARLPALYFVSGGRLPSPQGMALVRRWPAAGHGVANHGYSHLDFNRSDVTLPRYIEDARRNHLLLSGLPGWTPRFRAPYLKEGDTAAKRDGFRRWLETFGYSSGWATLITVDWHLDASLRRWLDQHPGRHPGMFREPYLDHVVATARYYDKLSRARLGRSVDHVMLLHVNALNAYFLRDVIIRLRQEGWTLITPSEAYRDPVYRGPPLGPGEEVLWRGPPQTPPAGLPPPAVFRDLERIRFNQAVKAMDESL